MLTNSPDTAPPDVSPGASAGVRPGLDGGGRRLAGVRPLASIPTAIGAVLVLVAVPVMYQASRTANLPVALVLFLVGCAAATAAVVLMMPCLAGRLDLERRVARRWVAFGVLGFGSCLVAAAVLFGSAGLLGFGLLVMLVGAGLLDIQVDRGLVPYPGVLVAVGAVSMMVGAVLVVVHSPWLSWAASLGPPLLFLGFPVLKVGLPGALSPGGGATGPNGWGPAAGFWSSRLEHVVKVGSAMAGGAGAGLVVGAVRASDPSWSTVVWGFALLSVAFALSVEIGLRYRPDSADLDQAVTRVRGWLLVAVGAVLAGAGAIATLQVMHTWRTYLPVLLVIGFAVGSFFVLRGEAGLFLILVGFVLLWTTHSRSVGPQDFAPTEPHLVVGLGDSYMAGQGSSHFYDGNNSALGRGRMVTDGGSDCRRSPDALPAALAALSEEWGSVNLACSGAVTGDVVDKAKYDSASEVGSVAVAGTLTQLDELAGLGPDVLSRVDLIVVSIGGNDSGFSKVIKACLLPADCSDQVKALTEQLDGSLVNLAPAYQLIGKRLDEVFGDDRPTVMVIPYPEFLTVADCGLTVSPAESEAILGFQRRLNDAIAIRAGAAGFEVFNEAVHAFADGLMVCAQGAGARATPGANFLHLTPHDPVRGLVPSNWVQGSMHPRAEGHRRLAELLARRIDLAGTLNSAEQETRPDAADGAPDRGADADDDAASIGDNSGAPAVELVDTRAERAAAEAEIDTWTGRELRRTMARLALTFALIMAGGLVSALGLHHAVGRWLPDSALGSFFPRPPER